VTQRLELKICDLNSWVWVVSRDTDGGLCVWELEATHRNLGLLENLLLGGLLFLGGGLLLGASSLLLGGLLLGASSLLLGGSLLLGAGHLLGGGLFLGGLLLGAGDLLLGGLLRLGGHLLFLWLACALGLGLGSVRKQSTSAWSEQSHRWRRPS
jgi:hypothetical protein